MKGRGLIVAGSHVRPQTKLKYLLEDKNRVAASLYLMDDEDEMGFYCHGTCLKANYWKDWTVWWSIPENVWT